MVIIYFRYKISSNVSWNELRELMYEVNFTVLDVVGVPIIDQLLHHLQFHPDILIQITDKRWCWRSESLIQEVTVIYAVKNLPRLIMSHIGKSSSSGFC